MTALDKAMLKVTQLDRTVTLTLNNPNKGNALSSEMVEALIAQTLLALSDDEVDTLQFTAEGSHFCTGLDLSALEEESDGDLLLRLVRIETLLALIWSAPIRTVAFAKGRTWGAGADLFVACEHRIADTNTSFRFPGAQFGIALGTARLSDRIGIDQTRQLILEGKTLDAQEALIAGLATSTDVSRLPNQIVVSRQAARAIRGATVNKQRTDHDLATLVRSAAVPGLQQRIVAYRNKKH
jgi:enoyl-CoA hydratase